VGRPARDVVAVVERLLAVQAQDLRGARLAVRVRSKGLVTADVDEALADRSVVVSWLNRGTLHLVRAEDYWWLHALTAPTTITANARRLVQEGVSPVQAERGVELIVRVLGTDGPTTRRQLAARFATAGLPHEGQALVHQLLLASLRGLIVRGPATGAGEQAFVLVRDWLGESPVVDREVALAELARRYLAGQGPADDRDLAKWAKLPLGDARAALRSIGDELQSRPDGLVSLRRRRAAPGGVPAPRLLGAFDPILLGWASRDEIVGAGTGIVTNNGLFRPFAMVDGRAAGIWTAKAGELRLTAFSPIPKPVGDALRRDALDVARYLSLEEFSLVIE
jgi:hypothetical protein